MNKNHTRYSWFVLGYNIFVILWGAFVRATGSGAGCGANWPLCGEQVLPQNPQVETLIEFGHRLTSGLALILVVVLLIWTFRRFEKGKRIRKAAAWSVVFILIEALIGAVLVLFEWTGDDESIARAVSISVHLANTFLLLGALTLTAWWSGNPDARLQWKAGFQSVAVMIALVGITIVGMTGAITALGDTLFPAASLADGLRQDLSPTSHFLIRLRVWHPLLSVFMGVYIIFIAGLVVAENKNNRANLFGWGLIALVITQLLAGIINLILLAPLWMQVVHLLLADLVWIMLVLFAVNLLLQQQEMKSEEGIGVVQEIIDTR